MMNAGGLGPFVQWLTDLAGEWRRQVGALPPDTLEDSGPIFQFTAPCQIDVIHLWHPLHRLDFRLCVFSHLDDLPDLQMAVHGPYYPNDFTKGLEAFVHLAKWGRPLAAGERERFPWSDPQTYADALSESILNAYGPAHVYLNNTVKSQGLEGREMGSNLLLSDCWSWGIAGGIEKTHPDPAAYVSAEIAERIRAQTAAKAQAARPSTAAPAHRGRGAFLLPGVWVGAAPTISVSEYLDQVRLEQKAHRQVALRTHYKGLDLTITQSGFFALAAEEPQEAAQLLNGLFAMMLFQGLPAMTVSPTDLIHVTHIDAPLTSYGYEDEVHADQLARLEGVARWSRHMPGANSVTTDWLTKAISSAGALPDNPTRALVMDLSLQSWTALRRHEYRSSFLTSWTGIELVCQRMWEDELNARGASKARRDRMKQWEISRSIDVLVVNGLIAPAMDEHIDEVRRHRNDVLHEGKAVTQSQAKQALGVCMSLAAGEVSIPMADRSLEKLSLLA